MLNRQKQKTEVQDSVVDTLTPGDQWLRCLVYEFVKFCAIIQTIYNSQFLKTLEKQSWPSSFQHPNSHRMQDEKLSKSKISRSTKPASPLPELQKALQRNEGPLAGRLNIQEGQETEFVRQLLFDSDDDE